MEHAGELNWRKSTFSGNGGDCVEVAGDGQRVLVRDSKDRGGPVLMFTHSEWRAFIGGARDGEPGLGGLL